MQVVKMRRSNLAAQLRELLAPTNPVSPPERRTPRTLDVRARDDLQKILNTPRLPTRGAPSLPEAKRGEKARNRRLLLGGLAAATAGAVIATAIGVLDEPRPAYAATPPPLTYQVSGSPQAARDLLLALAAKAEKAPRLPGHGPFGFVHTRGWYLGTRVDDKSTTSAVVPQETRVWMAEDGTGRIESRTLPPIFTDDSSREAWESDGAPGADVQAQDGPLPGPPNWKPGTLSTDPDQLNVQLEHNHPAGIGPVEKIIAITDLAMEQPIQPRLQAAVLKVLANTPSIVYTGEVTDRAGRPGIAFAIDSDYGGLPTRYTVIFDPDNGRLLGHEQALTGSVGKLNVRPGSIVAYTTFLTAGYTTDQHATP
jgi:hypothetical protein